MAYKPDADSYVDGTITTADIAASAKDAAAGTASLRSLGTGATQALAGNTAVELTTNKNAAGGYPGLNGSSLMSLAQMGTGTPSSSNFLRGDGTWAAPTTSYSTTTSTKTSAYTTTASDDYILVDAAGGAITIGMHAASTATKPVTIKRINSGANNVTIDPNASETIDGATTRVLAQQWESVTLVSNGSNWFVV